MFKRFLCILICGIFLTVGALTGTAREPSAVPGDVNGDEQCTAIDFVMIKRHVMHLNPLADIYLENADLSRDGKVNTADYVLAKRIVMGTYAPPAYEEPKPDEKTTAVLTLSLLLKQGDTETLVLLEGLADISVEELNTLVVDYLGSLSVDGETIAQWENGIEIRPENMEEIADALGDLLAEYILSALVQQQPQTP